MSLRGTSVGTMPNSLARTKDNHRRHERVSAIPSFDVDGFWKASTLNSKPSLYSIGAAAATFSLSLEAAILVPTASSSPMASDPSLARVSCKATMDSIVKVTAVPCGDSVQCSTSSYNNFSSHPFFCFAFTMRGREFGPKWKSNCDVPSTGSSEASRTAIAQVSFASRGWYANRAFSAFVPCNLAIWTLKVSTTLSSRRNI